MHNTNYGYMVTSINNIKYFIKMNNKTELITANKSMYKYQCFLFCCTMISLFFSFVTLATGRLVAGISCRKFWLGIWGGWNLDKKICQSIEVVSASNTPPKRPVSNCIINNLWLLLKLKFFKYKYSQQDTEQAAVSCDRPISWHHQMFLNQLWCPKTGPFPHYLHLDICV